MEGQAAGHPGSKGMPEGEFEALGGSDEGEMSILLPPTSPTSGQPEREICV